MSILKQDGARYRKAILTGQLRLIIMPETAEAAKVSSMKGMLPKQEGYSVYLTGYTPFKRTLEIS